MYRREDDSLIEEVQFRAVAPKSPLPGLDNALTKLNALNTALNTFNNRLTALTQPVIFKKSVADIKEMVAQAEKLGRFGMAPGGSFKPASLKPSDMAKALGYDKTAVESFLTQAILGGKSKEQKVLKQRIKELYNVAAGEFRSPTAAAKALSLFTSKFDPKQDPIAALKMAFATGGGGGSGQVSLTGLTLAPGGQIPLVIPADRIIATIGPGTIPATGAAAKKRGTTSGGTSAQSTTTPGEEKVVTREGKPTRVIRKYQGATGITIETVEEGGERISTAKTTKFSKQAEAELRKKIAELEKDLASRLATVTSARGMANVRDDFTSQAQALMSGKRGAEYKRFGLGGLVENFTQQTLPDAIQRQMVDSMERIGKLRSAEDKARKHDNKEREKEIQREIAAEQKRLNELNKIYTGLERARERSAKSSSKLADHDRKVSQASAFKSATYSGAQFALNDFLASGGRITSQTSPYKGKPAKVVATKEEGAFLQTLTVTYGKNAAEATLATKELRKEMGLLGGDFVKNTIKVAAWAASVALLYTSLSLAKGAMVTLQDVGLQTARLEQVFRGVGGSAQDLTSDVLHLAAANGRSAKEALDSAIQWSRLGLTRVQVNEAVRVSLMAANVAELTAAQATERLQAIMQNYNLRVHNLATVLGQLNQISNTYNVTNAAMLDGISRTAAIAKQAGLPLAELMGIIGATVGATAQSGANIGNAIKSVTLALSNPELQEKLRMQFKFETTTGGEEIKSLSDMLSDLYVKYEKLNGAQRQSMLFSIAGKTQASRLAAMLDNYVRAQVLAINAQLHLNSAEKENEKIVATLKAQLAGLSTEWQRFVVIQGNRGPVQALGEIATAMRNVLTLMNTKPGSVITTGFLGLMAAASAKTAMTAMSAKSGMEKGFAGRTMARIVTEASAMNAAINASVMKFAGPSPTGLMDKFVLKANTMAEASFRVARSSTVSSTAVKGLFGAFGVGLKSVSLATMALNEFLVPLAVIGVAIYGFNRGMEAIGLSSDAATSKVSGFTTEAERARSAADAMAQGIRLIGTMQKALSREGGLMPAAEVEKLIDAVSEISFAHVEDEKSRTKQTNEMRDQLKLMHEQKNVQGMQEALTQRVALLGEVRRRQLQDELAANSRSAAVLRAEIARLKDSRTGFWSFFRPDKRNKLIAEREGELSALQGRNVSNILEQEEAVNDEWERRLEYNTLHQAGLERQKSILQAIAEIYNNISAANPLEKAAIDLARITAETAVEKKNIADLTRTLETQTPGQKDRDRQVAALKEQEGIIRETMKRVDKEIWSVPGFGNNYSLKRAGQDALYGLTLGSFDDPSQVELDEKLRQYAELRKQLKQNIADQKSAAAGTLPGMTNQDSFMSLNKQISESQKNLKSLQAQYAGMESRLPLAQRASLFQYGQQRAQLNVSTSHYGIDEADKLFRDRKQLYEEISGLQAQQTKSVEEYGRLTKDIALWEQNTLDIRQRRLDVEREIKQLAIDQNREFTRSFFGSGAAEMLRKLAAFRMAFNPRTGRPDRQISQGEFFSYGPGMRGDLGMLTGQNPEMVALKNELARLKQDAQRRNELNRDGTENSSGFDQMMLKFADMLQKSLAGLDKELLKALPTDAMDAAKTSIDRLSKAADRAADSLMAIVQRFATGNDVMPARGGMMRKNPGQIGGYYSGAPAWALSP